MKPGDRVEFSDGRLYGLLKIKEEIPLIIEKIIGDCYIEIKGVKYAPKKDKGKTCRLVVGKKLLKKI